MRGLTDKELDLIRWVCLGPLTQEEWWPTHSELVILGNLKKLGRVYMIVDPPDEYEWHRLTKSGRMALRIRLASDVVERLKNDR